jgi:DNA-binding NarL/FixJ family response regulator
MRKTRLLIADDHGVVREGIRLVLKSSPDYRIVAEAEDGEQAVALARELHPDVVIMDISMPKLNGIEATSIIKKENPAIRIIILTVHEDEEYVYQILRAGASGYVLKSAGKKEIFAAIKSAVSGGRFFSPGVSEMIVDGFVRRSNEQEARVGQVPARSRSQLTRRETEVLRYIAQGLTNRKIAQTLYLSIRTVNTHRTNLMQKLDIHDTAGLVRHAIESGLVQLMNT